MRTAIKFIGTYIVLSVFLGLMWVVMPYPDIPSRTSEWLWILALALPLQLAFEFLGELLWNNKATVVPCHNLLGRAYIFVIAPFHRMVVKASLRRAAMLGWPREGGQPDQGI
jgi:hypothetical protein